MTQPFLVERVWTPAGESCGAVALGTHIISMTDGHSSFVEWSLNNSSKRKRRRVFAGDTWVLPQGHSWWTRRESDKMCIQLSFSDAWLRRIAGDATEVLPQVQLRDPLIAQLLRTLASTSASLPHSPTTQLYQESLATTLVLHLVAQYGHAETGTAQPLSSAHVQAITTYVSEHIADKMTLIDLARIVGLRATQFSLAFRETTGQTPHQFVTAMRVERARELLVSKRHSLPDVAALAGFADQSHLTRHLRRSLGLTPAMLKKQ